MPAELVILPVARTPPATAPTRMLRLVQVLAILVSIAGWLSAAEIHDMVVGAARRVK